MTAQQVDTDLHPLQRVRVCVAAVVGDLDGLPAGGLPGDGCGVESLIAEVVAAERRLGELRLRLVRVAGEQAEADRVAASGTDAWLAALTGTTRGAAAGGLWLARMLGEHYPAVRVARARGELSVEQARVIVRAAETVPATVSAAEKATAVEALVARAGGAGAGPVAAAMGRAADAGQGRPPRRGRAPEAAAGQEEAKADAETYLQAHEQADGTLRQAQDGAGRAGSSSRPCTPGC